VKASVYDATVAVLTETDNSAIMWGDTALAVTIAERAGMRATQPERFNHAAIERAVLSALSKACRARLVRPLDALIAAHTTEPGGRCVRIFFLRPHAPDWARAYETLERQAAAEGSS